MRRIPRECGLGLLVVMFGDLENEMDQAPFLGFFRRKQQQRNNKTGKRRERFGRVLGEDLERFGKEGKVGDPIRGERGGGERGEGLCGLARWVVLLFESCQKLPAPLAS